MKIVGFLLLAVFVIATRTAPTADEALNKPLSATGVHSNDIDHTSQKPLTKAAATEDEEEEEEDSNNVIDNIVSKLDVLLVEVNDDALEKCISNNETEALAKARSADENLERCLSPALEVLESSVMDIESLGLNIIQNVSQQFCSTYPPLEEKCSADYYNNIEQCLSESDMKGMKIYDNMVSAAAKYLCQYDPDVLIEAAENEFGCSVIEHITSFIFCIVPPFQEIVRNHHTAMAIPRILLGKGCRLYKDMALCVHEGLKTCKNQTFSDIIVGLFNTTANSLPECPSERTEWEQYMGQVVGQLYKEEQEQSVLLKEIKSQIDQLVSSSAQQQKFHEKDSIHKQNMEKNLTLVLEVLNGIKGKHSSSNILTSGVMSHLG